ncbi:hypothetical protein [Nonomuraea deserti]|uniref:hypothetical protein n=1 Tax=Nonomuraea deserti TaxID=1848322 RepID=UPI001C704159|nr:hypothetical protein [Nonomuraea deserti]
MRNHHGDGEWIEARWKHLHRVPVPFGDLAWDHVSQGLPPASEVVIADAVAALLARPVPGPSQPCPALGAPRGHRGPPPATARMVAAEFDRFLGLLIRSRLNITDIVEAVVGVLSCPGRSCRRSAPSGDNSDQIDRQHAPGAGRGGEPLFVRPGLGSDGDQDGAQPLILADDAVRDA